ncbi:tetratricopeptide repeat protein [Burkholderia stagnalis]|uniref:tetratricopeptide repeat protein n=1 Tax=Burkholderia stagnalis TaxID=1503054 RepID=UPI0013E01440|nr:tetratricopeptide repeat protein [Burkholderia stagnalis]
MMQSSRTEASAQVDLGNEWRRTGHFAEALACYQQAIALSPDFARAYCCLGDLLYHAEHLAEAETCFRQALSLDPVHVGAQVNLSVILTRTNRLTEAEVAARRVLEIAPGNAVGEYNLALVLLKLGDYARGWPLHEARYADSPDWDNTMGHQKLPLRLPIARWQGESLEGKSLLVYCEQGLGDALQFARYFPLLKAQGVARLTIACEPPLKRLFRGIKCVDEIIFPGSPVELFPYDYWCMSMSLPFRFGTTLETIPASLPYVGIPENCRRRWKQRLRQRLPPGQPRVGLVWAGSPRPTDAVLNATDRRRSIHLGALLPILQIPNITFVSLQKGDDARSQLHALPPALRPVDLMDEVEDFVDTGAIIQNLDLVVTVDTSVAHLTGALNMPVWILSRYDGCWRWLQNRDDSPWYPGVARLFRQERAGDWDAVVARVVAELRSRFAGIVSGSALAVGLDVRGQTGGLVGEQVSASTV